MNYESGNEVLLKELIGMSIKVDFADKGEINEPYATEYREELQYIKGIILARMEGLKQPLNFTKGTNVKPRTGKVRIVGEEDHIHIPTNHDLTVNRVWYEGKGLWSVWEDFRQKMAMDLIQKAAVFTWTTLKSCSICIFYPPSRVGDFCV